MTDGALAGMTVVDVTTARSGPTCTRQLADYGASVVWVGNPGRGDVSGSDGDNLVSTVPGNDSSEARNLGHTARLYIRPVIHTIAAPISEGAAPCASSSSVEAVTWLIDTMLSASNRR